MRGSKGLRIQLSVSVISVLIVLLAGCNVPDEALKLELGEPTLESDYEPVNRDEEEVQQIYVYVCGAVKQVGVYSLPEGSRAVDALEAAGGYLENASEESVNLATRLTDGQQLKFLTVEEYQNASTNTVKSVMVNINTADIVALCTLPGIGETRAKDIIAYRDAHGPFESLEDIQKVSGIKGSTFQKIKERITVQ